MAATALAAALAGGCGGVRPPAQTPALAARTTAAPPAERTAPPRPAASAAAGRAAPAPAAGRRAAHATAAAAGKPAAAVAPIPPAYRAGPVSHLVVAGADKAIKWYEQVLGAKETYLARGPKGRVMHAILRVGDADFTLSDAYPELGSNGPKAHGGASASIRVEVGDADALFKKALAAGAHAVQPMTYELSGDRVGRFTDPFGQSWQVATHVADVPPTALGELAGEAAGAEPPPVQPSPPQKAPNPTAKPKRTVVATPAPGSGPPGSSPHPKPAPETGKRPQLTPDLVVTHVDKAVAFYEAAFGAKERSQVSGPSGKVIHAAIVIRRQLILLDAPAPGQQPPSAHAGAAASLTLYVKNADAAFKKAVAAGASARLPVMDMFWGDRWGELVDPFGQVWSIATHKHNVSLAEIEKRAAAAFAKAR